jgi:hypothetical protein
MHCKDVNIHPHCKPYSGTIEHMHPFLLNVHGTDTFQVEVEARVATTVTHITHSNQSALDMNANKKVPVLPPSKGRSRNTKKGRASSHLGLWNRRQREPLGILNCHCGEGAT